MKIYMVAINVIDEPIESLNGKFYFDKAEAVKDIISDCSQYEFDEEEVADIMESNWIGVDDKMYYIQELSNDSGLWELTV